MPPEPRRFTGKSRERFPLLGDAMDMTMQLFRTEKGHEEIFNHGHTLLPRQRQILFAIGNGISFVELRNKLPSCAELETMLNDLLQSGFIQPQPDGAVAQAAPVSGSSKHRRRPPSQPASPQTAWKRDAATYWNSWPRWWEPNPRPIGR